MKKLLPGKLLLAMVFALFPLLSQAETFTDDFDNLDYVDEDNTDAFYDSSGKRFMLPEGSAGLQTINQIEDALSPKVEVGSSGEVYFIWEKDDKINLSRQSAPNAPWTNMAGEEGSDEFGDTSSYYRSFGVSLDTNNNPTLSWLEFFEGNTHITRWSGSEWVKMDGSPGTEEIPGDFSDILYSHQLFLDSSNRPFIVWLGSDGISDGIFITRWSGSGWVKMDGSPGFEHITNEDSEAQVKEGLQLSLDSNDNPHITWSKGENNWDMDIFITRWSGSEWVKMDGSPGFEQITNRDEVIDSTSYENAYFLLDSFNNPIVIYIDFYGFYLTRWSGSEWVKMDGSPGFESVLDVGNTEIQATIDSGNNPIIALVAEIPDVMRRSLLLRYNSSYTPSAFLQSKNILSDTQTISSVTLTAETETPSGTTLGYELSFDEGANWEEVQSGVALDFSPSTDIDSMIYRIHLQTTVPQTTPIVNSVTINYTRAPFCGDGIINQPSEQCDDGNTQDGDGCSSTCQIEEEPDTPDTFTVSGVVFNDQNKDALRQAEEGLYENVTVDIIDSEDNIVSTTTTNNKGVYTFTVPEGDYTIKVTDTKKILANLDATTPQEIKLTINRDLTEQDFGYFAPIPRPIPDPTPEDPVAEDPKPEGSTSKTCSGFIGDTIWLDENGNGKEDKNEKGVNNISLKLKWAGEDNKWNTKDDKEFKTKTNRKGYYEFKGLKEGRYKVKVDEKDIKKEKLIQTYDPSGSTMDLTATVNLECNEKHTKADFGFKKEEPVKTLFATGWNRILPKMIFWVALALSLGMSIWSWQIRKETRSM